MAKSVTGISTWFTDTINTDISHVDLATLANGRVVIAFGGGTSGSAQLNTALVNTALTGLGPLQTKVFAPASGSLTVLRSGLEIDARPGGGFTTTFTVNNTAIGPDTTFGGLIQFHNNTGAATGPGRLLDSANLGNHMADNIASVVLGNGQSMVFTTSGLTFGAVNGGIKADIFRADGTLVGSTRSVVDSVNLGLQMLPSLTSDPEIHGAVRMANGNVAITYRENVKVESTFSPIFDTAVFQIRMIEVNATTGAVVGDPLQITGATGALSEITRLKDGRLLVIWQDATTDAMRIKGQLVSADGDTLIGSAFNISAMQTAQETLGDVVALNNGGFAISWTNGFNSHHLARLFKADGTAASNDFLLTDNGATYAQLGDGEITAVGNTLVAMTTGIQAGDTVQKIFGQVWSTADVMGRTGDGNARGNTMDGTGKDDRLSGLGGNDTLKGLGGNDILQGGDGRDKLIGAAGRDVLVGGAGADTLTGGAGADVFMFATRTEGPDRITDFSTAQGDRIAVDNLGFGTTIGATVLPLLAVTLTSDNSADEAGFHFNTRTKLFSYDYDGSGTAYDRIAIAYLPGVATLTSGDFLVY